MTNLPTFPKLPRNASESLVEMYVEALMNRADKELISGAASQSAYDVWVKRLNKWSRI
jgi:hypothetical protein